MLFTAALLVSAKGWGKKKNQCPSVIKVPSYDIIHADVNKSEKVLYGIGIAPGYSVKRESKVV